MLAEVVEDAARNLYVDALKVLPPDVEQALNKAYKAERESPGKEILGTMLQNIKVAEKTENILCQDTGTPIYFFKIGTEFPLSVTELVKKIRIGCERATLEHPLRPNIVNPITRINTRNNVGRFIPIIYLDFISGADYLKMMMVPKGSGSENQSCLKMLIPAEGLSGIKKFVVESIIKAGANPCPPTVVGVGIGGTFELCAMLATRAAMIRQIGSSHPDEKIAVLEHQLLIAANKTGIGPMGLGGSITALAVHIETADTHITQLPVAVNFQCWVARRAGARIDSDGQVRYISHFERK